MSKILKACLITELDPDILESEVKCSLENISNKAAEI